MARNSEKAQSMLFRFRAQQAADMGVLDAGRTRRPKNISEQTGLPVCEKWRAQVVKEISRKVTRIQEPTLSDGQIRDLNDEINKLMREKYIWELQIRNLGGPNYMRGAKVYDEDGVEIPGGGKGYKYFGRARELPGVKELFEAAKPKPPVKDEGNKDMKVPLSARYFGYLDEEEEAELLEEERKEEERLIAEYMAMPEEPLPEGWVSIPGDIGDGVPWDLPTQEEVQEELVRRRQLALLDKIG